MKSKKKHKGTSLNPLVPKASNKGEKKVDAITTRLSLSKYIQCIIIHDALTEHEINECIT